jgi:hypothetical protein
VSTSTREIDRASLEERFHWTHGGNDAAEVERPAGAEKAPRKAAPPAEAEKTAGKAKAPAEAEKAAGRASDSSPDSEMMGDTARALVSQIGPWSHNLYLWGRDQLGMGGAVASIDTSRASDKTSAQKITGLIDEVARSHENLAVHMVVLGAGKRQAWLAERGIASEGRDHHEDEIALYDGKTNSVMVSTDILELAPEKQREIVSHELAHARQDKNLQDVGRNGHRFAYVDELGGAYRDAMEHGQRTSSSLQEGFRAIGYSADEAREKAGHAMENMAEYDASFRGLLAASDDAQKKALLQSNPRMAEIVDREKSGRALQTNHEVVDSLRDPGRLDRFARKHALDGEQKKKIEDSLDNPWTPWYGLQQVLLGQYGLHWQARGSGTLHSNLGRLPAMTSVVGPSGVRRIAHPSSAPNSTIAGGRFPAARLAVRSPQGTSIPRTVSGQSVADGSSSARAGLGTPSTPRPTVIPSAPSRATLGGGGSISRPSAGGTSSPGGGSVPPSFRLPVPPPVQTPIVPPVKDSDDPRSDDGEEKRGQTSPKVASVANPACEGSEGNDASANSTIQAGGTAAPSAPPPSRAVGSPPPSTVSAGGGVPAPSGPLPGSAPSATPPASAPSAPFPSQAGDAALPAPSTAQAPLSSPPRGASVSVRVGPEGLGPDGASPPLAPEIDRRLAAPPHPYRQDSRSSPDATISSTDELPQRSPIRLAASEDADGPGLDLRAGAEAVSAAPWTSMEPRPATALTETRMGHDARTIDEVVLKANSGSLQPHDFDLLAGEATTPQGGQNLCDALEWMVSQPAGGERMADLFRQASHGDSAVSMGRALSSMARASSEQTLGLLLLTTDARGGTSALVDYFGAMAEKPEAAGDFASVFEGLTRTPRSASSMAEFLDSVSASNDDRSGGRTLARLFRQASQQPTGATRINGALARTMEAEGGARSFGRVLSRMSGATDDAAAFLENLGGRAASDPGRESVARFLTRAVGSRDGARQVLDSFTRLGASPTSLGRTAEVLGRVLESGSGARFLSLLASDPQNARQLSSLLAHLDESSAAAGDRLAIAFERLSTHSESAALFERVAESPALGAIFERFLSPAEDPARPLEGTTSAPTEGDLPPSTSASSTHRFAWARVEPSRGAGALAPRHEGLPPTFEEVRAEARPDPNDREDDRPVAVRFRPSDVYSEDTLLAARICGECGFRLTPSGRCARCAHEQALAARPVLVPA